MSDQGKICEFCGAPLSETARFCEACGKPVLHPPAAERPAPEPAPDLFTPPPAQAAPSQPYSMPTPPAQPTSLTPTAPARKDRTTLAIILGVVGCLGILCIGVVLIGAIFFINKSSESSSSSIEQVVKQKAIQLPTETGASASTGAWSQDIGQELTDTQLADDFSSNLYGWADDSDTTRTWAIEAGHYSVHMTEADYIAWAYLPVDFNPQTVEFEAALAPGYEAGAYGVLCHYQDQDNYHYVAIDPLYQEYSIGKYVNNVDTMLLKDWWVPAQHLQSSSTDVNRVKVVCRLDQIELYINGQLETQVSMDPAFPGRMAVYAETWEDMPADGFKVLFDNLTASLK